jgi:hypothetical protein
MSSSKLMSPLTGLSLALDIYLGNGEKAQVKEGSGAGFGRLYLL